MSKRIELSEVEEVIVDLVVAAGRFLGWDRMPVEHGGQLDPRQLLLRRKAVADRAAEDDVKAQELFERDRAWHVARAIERTRHRRRYDPLAQALSGRPGWGLHCPPYGSPPRSRAKGPATPRRPL